MRNEHRDSLVDLAAIGVMLTLLSSAPGFADTCTVPGTHGNIQEAVDDPSCATITLGDRIYSESVEIRRPLAVTGPVAGGAVVQGLILVTGSGTTVQLADVGVSNGCSPDAFRANGGATVVATGVTVQRSGSLPCPDLASSIFHDGFESGDAGAWSGSVP